MRPASLRGALALLAIAAGCGETAESPPGAPLAPRAAIVLEPSRLGVGDVARLDVVAVTPPGWSMRPYRPPEDVPGVWLLEAGPLDVEKQRERWTHRTRLRIRPHAVGETGWPASEVVVEAPDGGLRTLPLRAHPLEVVSVRGEYPDRITPFGLRRPPALPEIGAGALALAAGGGALFSLACVGLAWLAVAQRRARRAATDASRAPPRADPPWVSAREALVAARGAAGADPIGAAHATSLALCRYMTRRFGAAALARTVEELRDAEPPFGARSRWPGFVGILEALDAFRFRPAAAESPEALAERVRACADRALALVEDTVPPESLR